MDGKRNRKTLNIENFKVGDLVVIAGAQIFLEEPDFSKPEPRVYGVVVEFPDESASLSLFPQIAVFVFKKQVIELHWPSYLEIVSSTGD